MTVKNVGLEDMKPRRSRSRIFRICRIHKKLH